MPGVERVVLTALLLLALAACGAWPTAVRQPISVITVSADLATLPSGAPVYWARLGADLQTELAHRFVNDISPEGHVLLIDIDEASLAAAYQSGFAADKAGLGALVTLTRQDGRILFQKSLSVQTSAAAGGVQSYDAGSSDYYAALIRAFADRVDAAINPGGP